MFLKKLFFIAVLVSIAAAPAAGFAEAPGEQTFDKGTILKEAADFFGEGAEGLAEVVEKAFKDLGRPNGYIKGEEAGGAIAVGVRYGSGTLILKRGEKRTVYWQGPSIGFDLGANAAKVIVLVYNLDDSEYLFQRFPSIEGSLYFVAGVGVNYMRSGDTILAPIRLGVGWRQGASVGYMHFTKQKSWNPL